MDNIKDSKMNIVFAMNYSDSTGGAWDGIFRFYNKLAGKLNYSGLKSFIAFPKKTNSPIFIPENLSVVEVNLTKFTNRSNLKRIKNFIKKNKIKLIIFVDISPFKIRFDILKHLGVKTINCSRWGFSENEKPSKLKIIIKRFIKFFQIWEHDLYIAVSQTQKKYLINWSGLPVNRVSVAENGIDTQRFSPGASPSPSKFNLPERQMYVLMACQARPEKNIDLLIDVADVVVKKGLSVCFIYAGDGLCKSEWETKVANLGINEHFYFLGHVNDLVPLYRLTDLFVHASSREASPRVIMEALSSGIPVVASAIEPHREILENANTGWLISKNSVQAYAEKIVSLYHSKELRSNSGQIGLKYAKKYLSVDVQVEKFEKIIFSLLRNKNIL